MLELMLGIKKRNLEPPLPPIPPVDFISTRTYTFSGSAALTASLPTGALPGDLVVMFMFSVSGTIKPALTNWTKGISVSSYPNTKLDLLYKTVTASEPSFSIKQDSIYTATIVMLLYRGAATVESAVGTTGMASFTFPVLNVTTSKSRYITAACPARVNVTPTTPTGQTSRAVAQLTQISYRVCDELVIDTGPTPPRTSTASGGTYQGTCMSVLIR